MASLLGNVFGNLRSNLSTLEQVLTGLLGSQAVIVQFAASNNTLARIVSGAFGVVAVTALVIKNVLANTSNPPPPAKTTFKLG